MVARLGFIVNELWWWTCLSLTVTSSDSQSKLVTVNLVWFILSVIIAIHRVLSHDLGIDTVWLKMTYLELRDPGSEHTLAQEQPAARRLANAAWHGRRQWPLAGEGVITVNVTVGPWLAEVMMIQAGRRSCALAWASQAWASLRNFRAAARLLLVPWLAGTEPEAVTVHCRWSHWVAATFQVMSQLHVLSKRSTDISIECSADACHQRIHSSGLKIPVGRTCCMLLWVCERSLKASAVFTKGCDLLWTHVTLRIDPPTLRCGRTFRRLRSDWTLRRSELVKKMVLLLKFWLAELVM